MDKNDSPPKFFELPSAFNVSEDLGAGYSIATIRAIDPDTIGSLSFNLVDGDTDNKFDLDEDTGVLRLRDTLDREAKDVYRLTMRVSDGVQFTDANVNIQVREEAAGSCGGILWNSCIVRDRGMCPDNACRLIAIGSCN